MKQNKLFPCYWQGAVLLVAAFILLVFTGIFYGIVKVIITSVGLMPPESVIFPLFMGVLQLFLLLAISAGVLYYTKTNLKVFLGKGSYHAVIIPFLILVLRPTLFALPIGNLKTKKMQYKSHIITKNLLTNLLIVL